MPQNSSTDVIVIGLAGGRFPAGDGRHRRTAGSGSATRWRGLATGSWWPPVPRRCGPQSGEQVSMSSGQRVLTLDDGCTCAAPTCWERLSGVRRRPASRSRTTAWPGPRNRWTPRCELRSGRLRTPSGRPRSRCARAPRRCRPRLAGSSGNLGPIKLIVDASRDLLVGATAAGPAGASGSTAEAFESS